MLISLLLAAKPVKIRSDHHAASWLSPRTRTLVESFGSFHFRKDLISKRCSQIFISSLFIPGACIHFCTPTQNVESECTWQAWCAGMKLARVCADRAAETAFAVEPFAVSFTCECCFCERQADRMGLAVVNCLKKTRVSSQQLAEQRDISSRQGERRRKRSALRRAGGGSWSDRALHLLPPSGNEG